MGNSWRASRNSWKVSGNFCKVFGSFHEFLMNFVHAKTQCFRMYEIHMKFMEASGKCQVVSGKFPGVSGSLPDPSVRLLGAWGVVSGSCTEVPKRGGGTRSTTPRARRALRSFICTASGVVCLPLKQGFKFRFHGNRFPSYRFQLHT